jgi:hypothetical protein
MLTHFVRSSSLVIVMFCLPLMSRAQAPNTAAPNTKNSTDASVCQREVSKFEQAISFARNAQGVAAAAQLKERLLPAKVEADLLFQEGYCGLARYLRDKRLLD